jgi:hypothetical protein
MVKKSITVTEEQAAWMQAQMSNGHCKTDSVRSHRHDRDA